MRRQLNNIKGVGYVFWHARHMLYHLLLGLAWVWLVRDQLGIYGVNITILGLIGSVLPDTEHILFYFTYGKGDAYTKQIKQYIKGHDWRVLVRFIEQGHKYNTQLSYHNIYTVLILMFIGYVSLKLQWFALLVISGAMITHYIFDIIDDLTTLGKINSNWFRWGRSKNKINPSFWKHLDKSIHR